MAVNEAGTLMVTADADRLVIWDVTSWSVHACALLPKGISEPWNDAVSDTNKQRQFGVVKAGFLAGGKVIATLERAKDLATVQCLRIWQMDGSSIRACAETHINQVRVLQPGACAATRCVCCNIRECAATFARVLRHTSTRYVHVQAQPCACAGAAMCMCSGAASLCGNLSCGCNTLK
jgi:hypothetical protein